MAYRIQTCATVRLVTNTDKYNKTLYRTELRTGLRGMSFDGTKSGGGNAPQPFWVRRPCLDGRENLIVVELLQNLNNDNHLKVFPYE